LRALRTERIDLLLLHEATADDLREDSGGEGLMRMLEDAVAAGTIGSFGVDGEREMVRTLAIKRPRYSRTMQFEWSVMDAPVPAMPGFRIHHRARTDNFAGFHAGLLEDRVRCAKWSETVGADLADGCVLASLMLKAALMENPESVILFSSKNPEHIRRNVETAGDAALEAPAKKLYGVVQAQAKGRRAIEAGG
jgi:aryl-alcohol dehydrogenase-like predicted oxidoreductase